MPTRTARTACYATFQEGSGRVELASSHAGTYDLPFPFPTPAAGDAGGATRPGELIEAAHSSRYRRELSTLIAEGGGTSLSLEGKAEVSLGSDPDGELLTGITLDASLDG